MQVWHSIADSPAFHCALEEFLLTERPFEDVLLLYVNRPSVIVGRNQCVEAEVDLSYCRRHDILVVRRISGGGTVFHDYGNVNYSFISNKGAVALLDRDSTEPVRLALAQWGVKSVAGKRQEILVDGRKVSGTAAYIGAAREMFHGTLLFNTNLETLTLSLRGDVSLRGKRVASVPSPVLNLSELPGVPSSIEVFIEGLISFFQHFYGENTFKTVREEDFPQLKDWMQKYYRE